MSKLNCIARANILGSVRACLEELPATHLDMSTCSNNYFIKISIFLNIGFARDEAKFENKGLKN